MSHASVGCQPESLQAKSPHTRASACQGYAGCPTSALNEDQNGPFSPRAFRYKTQSDFERRGANRHRGAIGASLPMGPKNSVFTCGGEASGCNQSSRAGLDSAAISYTERQKCVSLSHKDCTERFSNADKLRCFHDASRPQHLRTPDKSTAGQTWWPQATHSDIESSCRLRRFSGKRNVHASACHANEPPLHLHYGSTVAELIGADSSPRRGQTNSAFSCEISPPKTARSRRRSASSRRSSPSRSERSEGTYSQSLTPRSSQFQDEAFDMCRLSANCNASAQTRLLNERRLNPFAIAKRKFPVLHNTSDQFGELFHRQGRPKGSRPPRPESARSSSSGRRMELQRPSSARAYEASWSLCSDTASSIEQQRPQTPHAQTESFQESGRRALGVYSPVCQGKSRWSDALPSPRWGDAYKEASGVNDWRYLCESIQASARQHIDRQKQQSLYSYLRNKDKGLRDILGTGCK